MRVDDVTSRRGRGPILLTLVCAVMLTAGLLMLLAGLVLHVAKKHPYGSVTRDGALVCAAGMALGIAILALYALGKAFTGRRRRIHNERDFATLENVPSFEERPPAYAAPGPGRATAGPGYGHAQPPPRHEPPAGRPGYGPSPGYGAPPGYGSQPGYGPQSGYGPPPGYSAPREDARPREEARPRDDGRGRGNTRPPSFGSQQPPQPPQPPAGQQRSGPPGPSGQPGPPRSPGPRPGSAPGPRPGPRRPAPAMDPTGVYSPGGLIGAPREKRDAAPNVPGREFDRPAPPPVGGRADDAEYAEVVHVDRAPRAPREQPKPPAASSVPPEPDVFLYRDPDDPAESEASPVASQTARGPFEPLVKSGEDAREESPPAIPPDHPAEDTGARPIDQIKDLYATAEAIGDDNLDRHFDELMRRQRELISDYFKESGAGNNGPGDEAAVGTEHPA